MEKEALLAMLKSKLGDDVDLSGITDEDIIALTQTHEEEDDDVEDEEQDEEQDEAEDEDVDTDVEEDDDFDLDDLDESQMTQSEKMLFRALKKQRETNRRDKLNNVIASAQVDDTVKGMLKEMVLLGADKEKIESLISKAVEDANKNKRKLGAGTRMFSKNKVKAKTDKTQQKIKIGSRAWGESL